MHSLPNLCNIIFHLLLFIFVFISKNLICHLQLVTPFVIVRDTKSKNGSHNSKQTTQIRKHIIQFSINSGYFQFLVRLPKIDPCCIICIQGRPNKFLLLSSVDKISRCFGNILNWPQTFVSFHYILTQIYVCFKRYLIVQRILISVLQIKGNWLVQGRVEKCVDEKEIYLIFKLR